jgi:SAM-dependent methyltransferase
MMDMTAQEIPIPQFKESSPDTLSGSFTDDLIISKAWLCQEIANIQKTFDAIYVLGSWYGNMSLFLIDRSDISFNKIINVDIDPKSLKTGQQLAKKLRIEKKIYPLCKDVNRLIFGQAKNNSLVINTSCNDIENRGWFDRVPKGALVALQARNNVNSVNQFDSIGSFEKLYPFKHLIYRGSKKLQDPETAYHRYMLIGIR